MIREAEAKDAKSIERLYIELLPNQSNIKVLEERIQDIRNNPNSYLFVYEKDERIIGTAHLHICLDALVENRPFGVVERVVVSQEVQGNGYGTELMKHIETICKELNCVKMMLTSNASRQEAHDFYRRLDFNGESSKAFKKYL